MKQNYDKLMLLLSRLPDYNISKTRNELSKILTEFIAILEIINKGGGYRRKTNRYYTEISNIEKKIHNAKEAKSEFEKDHAFLEALETLKTNIKELAALINTAS